MTDTGVPPSGSGYSAEPEPKVSAVPVSIPNAGDPDPWQWYWGYGGEPEAYYGGEDTRDAILQVARNDSDGETFTIIEAKRGGFNFDIFDGDRVLEEFDEQNEECWGEDGPDFKCPAGSKRVLEKMLESVFEAWFDEYKPTRRWAFEHMRNEETFLSAEDEADEAIATEAGTAETTKIGSVHEGAGPKDIAR